MCNECACVIQKEVVTLKYLTLRRSAPDSAEELIIQSGSSFESAKTNK